MNLLKLFLPILALLGILDSSYITYEKALGRIPQCISGFSCTEVLTSPWASIGPMPLSVLGILYYATILVLSSALFLECTEIRIDGKRFSLFQLVRALTTFGCLFSLYLIFLMAVVIKGWCMWCLFSALTSSLLFVCTSVLALFRKKSGISEKEYPLLNALMAVLYQRILKPILFQFNPESVHHLFVSAGALMGKFWLMRVLSAMSFSYSHKRLECTFAGITFPNPVGLSAGFDYDSELTDILPCVGFGFATLGTVTLGAYEGNPKPMLARFPDSKALLVNKGFKSQGAKAVISRLEGKNFAIPIGISIGSTNKEYKNSQEQIADIVECYRLFENSTVQHSYYELNISCPNTKGGQPFTDVKRLSLLLVAVEKLNIKKPIFLKMPIDLSEKESLGLLKRAAESSLISGVVLGNLTKDHANPDVSKADRERWKHMQGNLSGKPTWKRSNTLIALTRKTFGKRFVIIGTGGVFSGEDAQEKLRLGADLVQLITGMIYQGPQLIGEITWTLTQNK